MTGRRRSYLEKWAPAHNTTVEEATNQFPEQAGISRYGQPEEIADLLGFMVSPAAKWMTGASVRMDGGEIKGVYRAPVIWDLCCRKCPARGGTYAQILGFGKQEVGEL